MLISAKWILPNQLKISFLKKILTESDYKFGKGDLLDSANLKIYISFLTTDTAKKLQKKHSFSNINWVKKGTCNM